MKPNQNDELAEQLLDTKQSERPKKHVLKTPKKPTAEEKEKGGWPSFASCVHRHENGCPSFACFCKAGHH